MESYNNNYVLTQLRLHENAVHKTIKVSLHI